MRQEKEDMDRLDERLGQHLHREPAPFDFEQWAHRFPEEARLLQAARPAPNRRTQVIRIGRCIMASRYTKFVGVAAVVLVAVSFLFPGRHGLMPESVAWADVQNAMEQMYSVRVTGTRNCFFSQDQTPTYKLGVEKLFSRSGSVDRTFTEDGRLIIEFTYDLSSGTVTVLFPTYKRYYRAQMPEGFHENVKQATPEKVFTWLFASGDFRKVGPKEVQGIQAVGFEVSDLPERFTKGLGLSRKLVDFFVSFGPSSTCMWVNPETRLPIQLECEAKANPCLLTGYREMKLHEVDDRWEFDVELNGAQFLPAIPEDYQPLIPAPVSKAQAAGCLAGVGFLAPAFLAARRSRRRRSRTPVTTP